jgi:hypothetical protein
MTAEQKNTKVNGFLNSYFFERMKRWWYDIENIFHISFVVSFYEIHFRFEIFSNGLEFHLRPPNLHISNSVIQFLERILDHNRGIEEVIIPTPLYLGIDIERKGV